MRSKDGQHYPTERVPGDSEVLLGHATAEDPEATNRVLTEDGALAIDGGKLPGNNDDFDGEVDEHARRVAGAFGDTDDHERSDEVTRDEHDKNG
ncbi:MAG TPA: hypothetical protein VGE01_07235 [Fimbriimonas sp.]